MDDTPQPDPVVDFRDVHALAACSSLRGQKCIHVAPDIPEAVLRGVAKTYFRLRPDELLLAVVDYAKGKVPAKTLVLTTRRLAWFGRDPHRDAVSGPTDPTEPGPTWERSLAYERLPRVVETSGWFSKRLKLADDVVVAPDGLGRREASALVEALGALAQVASTGAPPEGATFERLQAAAAELPAVVSQSARAGAIVQEAASFETVVRQATPHVLVTPLIALACVFVYVLMVATGVSAFDPDAPSLLRWGGNLGASIAIDGEYWRLFTMMFLHGGLLHILFNMWCLVTTGPLIERLYGNFGFALLYVVSGLGGALASSWWHPLVVGVGASGAIFGMLGGMLAFLLVHRQAIPPSVLEPLRSSVLGMVGYNILFGLQSARIDNAAHIGGLVSGFLAGLVLTRRWPAAGPLEGVPRQALGAAALAAGLVPLGSFIGGQIQRNPQIVDAERSIRAPVDDYNTFVRAVLPQLNAYDALNRRTDALIDTIDRASPDEARALRDADALIADADANRTKIDALPAGNADLATLRGHVSEASSELAEALRALRRALQDQSQSQAEITGPNGFNVHRKKSEAAVEKYTRGVQDYFQKHGMVQAPRTTP